MEPTPELQNNGCQDPQGQIYKNASFDADETDLRHDSPTTSGLHLGVEIGPKSPRTLNKKREEN
jgi:hypothetical protein